MSRWGFGSAVHGTANVGTASAQAFAANANRVYMLIRNLGTAAVYLHLGGTATPAATTEGIVLDASTGSYEMTREKGNIWDGAIQGISAVAGMKVVAIEGESLNPT